MTHAFNLAGFAAAHVVWILADCGAFSPVLFCAMPDGKRTANVFDGEMSECAEMGKQALEANEERANQGVLVVDGRITLPMGKVDSILIEIRAYDSPLSRAAMAVPYSISVEGQIRVFKPKLLAWHNCEAFDVRHTPEAFYAGAKSHEKAWSVWSAALDQDTNGHTL